MLTYTHSHLHLLLLAEHHLETHQPSQLHSLWWAPCCVQGGSQGHQLVVFDIPLLYETGAQAQCDAVAVASAPADVQRERVMARPGMSEAKYLAILDRQVSGSLSCSPFMVVKLRMIPKAW